MVLRALDKSSTSNVSKSLYTMTVPLIDRALEIFFDFMLAIDHPRSGREQV